MTAVTHAIAQGEAAIATKGLSSNYGGREVLSDIDLCVNRNEILCIIGHNGAGKSTLLKLLFGLHKPSRGDIFLNGMKVNPNPKKMAGQGIAYVPEGRGVFPNLTVRENFSLALWSASVEARERPTRVDEVLAILPRIRDFWTQRAGELSGGQQQMVSIGRALLSRPTLLMLDEPSIGLAPKLFQDLLAPVREVQKNREMSIILVEQQVGEALHVSDRVAVMKSGAIIRQGIPADFADRQALLQLF